MNSNGSHMMEGNHIYNNSNNSIVTVIAKVNNWTTGSGFFIKTRQNDRTDYIVTCYHNLYDNKETTDIIWILVNNINQTNTNKYIKCRIIGVDGAADIAVLEPLDNNYINNQPLLEWGNSRLVENGQTCYVMGDPLGMDVTSICSGIIRDNKYVDSDGVTVVESILTDAPIYSGNSGGPIIDNNNKVIGMYSWSTNSGSGAGCLGGGVNQYILEPVVETIIKYRRNYIKSSLGFTWSNPQKALKELNISNKNHYIGSDSIKDADGLYIYKSNAMGDYYNIIAADIPNGLDASNTISCILLKSIRVVKMNKVYQIENNPIEVNMEINVGVMDNHFSPTSITWFLSPNDEIELKYKIVSYFNDLTYSVWMPQDNNIIHSKIIKVHEFSSNDDIPLNSIS